MNPYHPCGLFTALVTPFTNSGNIDFQAFEKLIDFQIQSGVDALVVSGSTGESATLTLKEKQALFIRAVEYAKGRIPVFAGTGTYETQMTLDLSIFAQQHGIDGLLIVTPYYNKPTQNGLFEHFRLIAGSIDLPVIIYNVPSRTGINMNADTQLRIAMECKNVVAAKEASGDLIQMMEIIRNSPQHFSLLSGDDALTLPVLACGGKGVISTISNYMPSEFSRLVRLALEGKFSQAGEIHYKMLELMRLTFIESNPIPVKAALAMMGKIKGVYRLPLTPMSPDKKKKLKQAMLDAGLL